MKFKDMPYQRVDFDQVEKEMHIFFRKEALLKEKGGFDEKGGPLVN